MIPYIHVPDLPIGPVTIHPFGVLVATGVLIGTALAARRCRALGLDLNLFNSFVTWMLVAGFIGGHVLDELFYHWDEVVKRPWSLFLLWEGLSSFGGFVGALIGILLWKRFDWDRGWFRVRPKVLPVFVYADVVLAVFPVAWIFGRSGCSTVHDHPGLLATGSAPLAVEFPLEREQIPQDWFKAHGSEAAFHLGPIELFKGHFLRYDLGLLELMFTIVVAGLFALTWGRKLQAGSYVVATAFAYGPVRFVMDFLRIPENAPSGGDTRYLHLTPAQFCCAALVVFGVAVVFYMRRLKKDGIDPAEPLRAVAPPDAVLVEPPLVA